MDLITNLPKTKDKKDAIIIFVDRLTKMIHAISTTIDVDALRVAQIFFKEIFRLHGLSKVIVSDRDPKFTSLFWKSLF